MSTAPKCNKTPLCPASIVLTLAVIKTITMINPITAGIITLNNDLLYPEDEYDSNGSPSGVTPPREYCLPKPLNGLFCPTPYRRL